MQRRGESLKSSDSIKAVEREGNNNRDENRDGHEQREKRLLFFFFNFKTSSRYFNEL